MIFVKGYACLNDEFHSKWIAQTGRLDHDEWLFKHLDQYVKEGDVVIDAGAHIGTHTIWYSKKVDHSGKVYAFEASTKAYECLIHNCKGIKNISLHNTALGEKSGTVTINEIAENQGMNFTTENGDIPMITIDSLGLNKLNFIKIDCEGAEPEILDGATETIARCKPIMFIEINKEALKRNGYTEVDVYEKLITLQYSFRNVYDTEQMEGIQYDIICIPNAN